MPPKKSIWVIDHLYDRAKNIHRYRYVLFGLCFVSFTILSFTTPALVEERTIVNYLEYFWVFLVSLPLILIGVYRADFALKWQCRLDPRVSKSAHLHLKKKMKDLAWELYGREVPE